MEKIIIALRKGGDVINKVGRLLLGGFSLMLCVAVIGQFVLRWFGGSLSWATEFSCYIFVWTTMLGSALASRHLMHIGVDILVNLLKGKVRKIVLIVANIIAILVLALFVYSGILYTIQQIPHNAISLPVSLSVFYCSLPLCALVMLYYTVLQTFEIAAYGNPVKIMLPGDEEEVSNE